MEKYEALLKERLSPKRFRHSLGVRDTALFLAKKFDVDEQAAALAGLLHDYAREIPARDLLQKAEAFGIVISAADRKSPILLHSPVGAALIAAELKVTDPVIARAISVHTTGMPHMTKLDKIIYLADCIEPNRKYSGVDKLRKKVERGLDAAVLAAMNHSLIFLIEHDAWIHENTILARNELLEEIAPLQGAD
ncbi:MAG: bis(5'-nucleosyl)-tetraphosphatase (symmetrical) YqeK [Sporomusaceae bacterium]|nr:bis(5'-nucleosyl)-tetraphosphatase (symmetrical) YqeK [Sporomusaceae bacterium]